MNGAALDVLRGCAVWAPSPVEINQAIEACAAVAELIEADKEYDAAITEGKELIRKVAEDGWFELKFDALRKSGERVVAAQIRRARALTNVEGDA